MGDVREKAAKAAREWELSESEVSGDCPRDDDGVLQASGVFVAGYLLGHAAGGEDGARDVLRRAHDVMERAIGRARKAKEITRTARLRCEMSAVAGWIAALQEEMFINPETRILSSLAPGTATPEPHCGWAPGHYKNICCICGKAFSDCDKRAVTCLPCADKELAKSSLAPGTGLGTGEGQKEEG